MNTKHTPSPWVAKGIHVVMSDGFQFKQQTPIGEGACIQTQQRNQERREANARLLAAAPDLLDCIIHLANRDWFREGETGEVICGLDADKVRAAIAKATGEEPA
jgi:hypothetical protein